MRSTKLMVRCSRLGQRRSRWCISRKLLRKRCVDRFVNSNDIGRPEFMKSEIAFSAGDRPSNSSAVTGPEVTLQIGMRAN